MLANGWLTFHGCNVLHWCPDGSRLGNLAEETELFPAWSPDNNKGIWLCPQAPIVVRGVMGAMLRSECAPVRAGLRGGETCPGRPLLVPDPKMRVKHGKKRE